VGARPYLLSVRKRKKVRGIRNKRADRLRQHQLDNPSKLEEKMARFIEKIFGDGFTRQYVLKGFLFDFKLHYSKVLIEVDGDWHHCNPKFHPQPLYEQQKSTVRNDKMKNKVAIREGYLLFRFWEDDINNRPKEVQERLKEIRDIYGQ